VRASDAAPRAAYDELVAQAARQLRPGVLTEEQWLRHSHADVPGLADWELRRELRVIVAYLDTLAGQRDWLREWYVERRQRLLQELQRRRRNAEQTDEQRVEQPVARQPKQSPAAPASPPSPRTDAGVFLPWRGVRK
jgi:hypothetical protein